MRSVSGETMSITYHICPYCRVATYPSYLGWEYRFCGQCGHTFDIDDTEAVTVGQSHTDGEASHAPRRAGVGPSTVKVRGGTL